MEPCDGRRRGFFIWPTFDSLKETRKGKEHDKTEQAGRFKGNKNGEHMSIDNFFWVPSGIRNRNDDTKNKFLRIETSKATPHQVFLAHGGNSLVDEQYFFEDAKDARWFW